VEIRVWKNISGLGSAGDFRGSVVVWKGLFCVHISSLESVLVKTKEVNTFERKMFIS
jgi:hypothetical protein